MLAISCEGAAEGLLQQPSVADTKRAFRLADRAGELLRSLCSGLSPT